MHGGDETLGQVGEQFPVFLGPGENLVVDVGDVADVVDVEAARAQIAHDDVEGHEAAGVAEMAIVVGGDPADVHAHLARFDRRELFLAACESVVDRKH